jgi:hypothetical protein
MFSNGLATGALAVLLASSQLAAAHMEISYPAPFRSRFNPNAVNIDYTNTAPLDATGSNYPCKGYHSDLGTGAGEPTATFAPGGAYNFTVVGSATHGGGSCQVSLSYDKGKTFTVIQSIIGGCPLSSNYGFTIPADAPTGEAIWAWTWNNNIGNREQYMNCAAVTIGAGGAKREVEQRGTTAFSSRPQVFVANIGNGCTTTEGTDVDYPNPGPDVVTTGSLIGKPVGNCGSGAGTSAGGGSASSSTVQATVAPTPSKAVSLPGCVQTFSFLPHQTGGHNPHPQPYSHKLKLTILQWRLHHRPQPGRDRCPYPHCRTHYPGLLDPHGRQPAREHRRQHWLWLRPRRRHGLHQRWCVELHRGLVFPALHQRRLVRRAGRRPRHGLQGRRGCHPRRRGRCTHDPGLLDQHWRQH